MSVFPITVYGDKILRNIAEPVKQVDDQIIHNIQRMFDTMRNADGIGLAANQVGLKDKLFIIDLKPVEGYENHKPVVMINPEIVAESEEEWIMEEGCLSLPRLRAEVKRSEIIKVRYLDTDENIQEIEADNLFARVILHEYDHLIGKMIPDRVTPDLKKKLQAELKQIMNREVEIDYPITVK